MASKTVLVAVEVPEQVSAEQVRTMIERAALHRWGLYADVEGRPRVAVWEADDKGRGGLEYYLASLQDALAARIEQQESGRVIELDERRKGGDEG